MNSQPLSNATRRLGAPSNWDHGGGICHTLEVYDRDGWMVSAWRPTKAELRRLSDGQPIFLHIQGFAHPVVALTVGGEPAVPEKTTAGE